eukprot:c8461_g1_i1.p1 GENE.c8461_g1_i1~~c8461_g1_i1.p1  ORF type:complete len:1083 (+),score=359.15 c8461_g1_i1:117-3365(+)
MAELEALLQHLMSADNDVRTEGERVFGEFKKQQPEQLVLGLLNLLTNSQSEDIRLMSSILLRKVLVRDDETVWEKLTPENKMTTKHALLSSLVPDQPKNRRRKACDIIAELASKEGESAVQLMPQLLEWSTGQNLTLRLSGLLIISQICKEVDEDLSQFVTPTLAAVQQNLGLPNQEHISLRVAALDVYASILSIGEKDIIPPWQSMLPTAIQLVGDILNLGKEQEARSALQILITIAETDTRGKLLKPHLTQFTQAMFTIASHGQLDDDLKNLALEFLLTVVANNPVVCRKMPMFAESLFSIAISRMLEVDDDIEEWNKEDPAEDDNDCENYYLGEEALDRMALTLRWNALRQACQGLMQQFLGSPDWKHRHAALMAISQIGEVIPQDELEPIVSILLNSFADPHPRVRWAAINGIGQLSSDFGPYIQDTFHAEIVPRLVAALSDNTNPRVQAHAASAVINFAEHLNEELLDPYLDTLLVALQALLQSPNPHVVAHSLPAIASIADVAEEKFAKYYDAFMPYLKAILANAHQTNNSKLLSKAIECITLVGVSVGKEKFFNDATDVIGVMLHTQQHSETEAGDPEHSYMLSAWTRVCKCLGKDFLPYLDTVMPSLLETVKLDDVIDVEGDSDDDEPEQVMVNTGLLDDKSVAVNMLYVYASELKGGFYPWVQRVLESLIPCLTFVYMADIRATAAVTLPELIRCVDDHLTSQNQPDRTPVAQLFFVVYEALTKAIQQEIVLSKLSRAGPEHDDAMASLVEGLHESLEVAGKGAMSPEQIKNTFALIQSLVHDFDEKHALREQSKQTEDYDDDVEDLHEEEYEKDDECLTELSLLFGTMLKTCDPALVLGYFDEMLQENLLKKLDPSQPANSRKMALFMFDDVIEYGQGASRPYFTLLVQALINYCTDEDAGVRQAATYGLGACASKGGDAFTPYLPAACQALGTVISNPEARSDENAGATDNAISALGKIMSTYPQTTSQLIAHFVDYLPLKHDLEEGYAANGKLLELLARDPASVLGQSLERLPKLLAIFAEVLDTDNDMLRDEQIPSVKLLVSQLAAQYAEAFQMALAKLDEDERNTLLN